MDESLKNQIRHAKNESTIESLLAKGKAFQFASPKTRRSWTKAADVRRAELHGKSDAKPTDAAPEVEHKSRRKREKVKA